MQTTIEISEQAHLALERLSHAKGLLPAQVAGAAVEAYLQEQEHGDGRSWPGLDAAFGLWKDREVDGLAYQQRMRAEWNREWDR